MKKTYAFLLITILAGTAAAATLNVPAQYPAIMDAVNAANTGDTVLIADGIYTGASNRGIDFGGRDIVLMSENGPHNCIIDCQRMNRGMFLHSGETSAAQIIGITISNGLQSTGGGVFCNQSSPTFERCIINDCQAMGEGGGVLVSGGAPTFINCVMHNNSANSGGGVSSNNSDITLNSCVVAANTSSG